MNRESIRVRIAPAPDAMFVEQASSLLEEGVPVFRLESAAAACLRAGTRDPGRLGSAIARCRSCAERARGRMVVQAQLRTRHVRR